MGRLADSYILFMTRHRLPHFEWCTLNTEEEHRRVSKPDTDDVVPRVYITCLVVASEKNIQVSLHASPISQNADSCTDVLAFHYRKVYTKRILLVEASVESCYRIATFSYRLILKFFVCNAYM